MHSVVVENLRKQYKENVAVDDVSFKVNEGETFGLIGPDGSGKTSIFRMLATLLVPDGGEAHVCGWDVVKNYKEIRKSVGYMPGTFSLYQDLTVEENLHFFATIFNTTIKENYGLIKDIYVQLEPFKNRRSGNLSGGMKQKLALCCALIHRPEVLFLDEPTTGVDTVSRKEFWEMLKKLKKEGITILVSTPYMDEATLCERIGLIQKGRLLSIDPPQVIIEKYPKALYAIKSHNMIELLSALRELPLIGSVHSFGEHHHITIMDRGLTLLDIRATLEKELPYPFQIDKIEPSVEDCFIQLMEK